MFVCLYADGYQVGFISFFAHMIVYHVNKCKDVQFKTVGKQVYDEVIEYDPLSSHQTHTYLYFLGGKVHKSNDFNFNLFDS